MSTLHFPPAYLIYYDHCSDITFMLNVFMRLFKNHIVVSATIYYTIKILNCVCSVNI